MPGIADVPYQQAVSVRMTFKGVDPVGDWVALDLLPYVSSIVPAVHYPLSAFLLSTEGLFFFDQNNTATSLPLPSLSPASPPPSSATPPSSFIAAPSSPKSTWDVAVLTPLGFARCQLASSSALACSIVDFPTPMNTTAFAVSSDDQFWIGTDQGLFYYNIQTSQKLTQIQDIGNVLITSIAGMI